MTQTFSLAQGVDSLRRGHIVAVPTEAVYGLSCHAENIDAVGRLLSLKGRAKNKGFIVAASDWQYLAPYVGPLSQDVVDKMQSTWPGPVTWVVPANKNMDKILRGNFDTIALRISDHPVLSGLCHLLAGAVVTTSANLSGMPPATTLAEIGQYFPGQLDGVVAGDLGGLAKPTVIRDALTGRYFRGSAEDEQ